MATVGFSATGVAKQPVSFARKLGGSGFIRIKHLAVFRDQAIQYLVEILKTPIGEVTVDHRLAQSYDAKSGKIELPNKLGAMQFLAKMCGWQSSSL